MALTSAYLITTKNLEPFFNSLITARAPESFTQKFLESLEFKSTNDRLYIGLLKGLGFLDATSVPTERYYKFLDQTQSKAVLAEAIQEAYGDLFAVNIKANELSVADVKNKLRTLTQGKNSDKVLGLMANTFKALVDYATWPLESKKLEGKAVPPAPKKEDVQEEKKEPEEPENPPHAEPKLGKPQLHYNIQIHLPETRDQAVYDSIFKSLKKHLF